LTQSEVGRSLDAVFVQGLPPGVDPCGENGEYHSFVHDGPIFRRPVAFEIGEIVYRPLLPALETQSVLDPAPASAQNIPIPAASGPTTTKGFWFVDLYSRP
jgi:hypothetical protein